MENTPPLGPAPIGPPLPSGEALSPARERLAAALAARPHGATIGELVAEVGGHPNTARFHLDALVSAGYASRSPRAAEGRGRPSMSYRLTAAGSAALGAGTDVLAAEYLGLATAFATHLAHRDEHPEEESRAVGRVWGRQLATGARPAGADDAASAAREHRPDAGSRTPRQQVVGLLARLGFSPEVDADADTQRVSLRTCPLLTAAREHPSVICSVHEGLVSGALEGFGAPDDPVRLVPFARPGACHLQLGPRRDV